MKLHYLLLLTFGAQGGNVEVEGEISIMLNDPSITEPYKRVKDEVPEVTNDKVPEVINNIVPEVTNDKVPEVKVRVYEYGKMTVGPVVECMYQIPEESQVQALLSNMMNELTKMFVRAHDMMNGDFRRKGKTRFRVISKKQTNFFEDIYSNMTQQYLTFYNSTAVRVDRSGRKKDPCENQEEMKELWKGILDSSLTTFRQAAFRCIDEHMRAKEKAKDSKKAKKVRGILNEYLLTELKKIKMSQLAVLCDKFQLCYNELIRRHDRSD